MKDITEHVPPKRRQKGFKYQLSPLAEKELERVAKQMYIDTITDLHKAVADSASSFLTSEYFVSSKWFREQPTHTFRAAELQIPGESPVTPVLVIRPSDGCILSELESPMPEDYHTNRILEETRVEYRCD